MKQRRWSLQMILLLACTVCGAGCATAPYRFGHFHSDRVHETPDQAVFVFGQPSKTLDRMAWVVALPTRLLQLHPKVNSHTLSADTTEKLQAYLQENDITDVLVRVNQYDPGGEWRRLRQNTRIAPGWRYTFGTASVIGYTLIPGRVFGGDAYNPFTNSLYVNSDVAAMLITEAAYAKDIHSRSLPGTYAAINEFPVLTLWRHTNAVNDTLGYALKDDDWELERETYRTVYPLMGIHAALGGQSAISHVAAMPMITIPISVVGGAIAGHTVGQTTIAHRERERMSLPPDELAANPPDDANDPPGAIRVSSSGVRLVGFEEISDLESTPASQEASPAKRRSSVE
ncbi:MAG: hypothetical protein JSS49_17095 [Planctomycetes bacterium]|nr:hypothetical protein [Planctomycetota bacterium]